MTNTVRTSLIFLAASSCLSLGCSSQAPSPASDTGGQGLSGNASGGSKPTGGSAATSSGGASSGGVTASGGFATGGNPASTGGTAASTGGAFTGGAFTGGGPTSTGGTTDSTGGTSAATGGTPVASGGTSAATGGTSAASGGTSAATGGTTTSTGGTATGGTSAATGGVPGATCGSTPLYTFDADLQGFAVGTLNPTTLAAPTLSWDSAVGNPTAGSLSLSATFTGTTQGVPVGKALSTPLDLTSRLLKVSVRVDTDPAASSSNPAGIQLFVKSGPQYIYANNGWTNLAAGGWIELVFDPTSPGYTGTADGSTFNPADIRELGVEMDTGGSGTFGAGAIHIDNFVLTTGKSPNVMPWTFDCGADGFTVAYSSATTLAPQLTWNGSIGNPSPGSLELVAAFSGTSQTVELARSLVTALDLTGATLTAKVKLESGLSTDTTNLGSTKLYVKTGSQYIYASGAPVNLTPGADWVNLSFPTATPTYTATVDGGAYDPAQVKELGVEINTGSAGTYTTATLHIDSIAK
jgi:hypothetical protein